MVRNIFTLTYLVVACVSIVSALPAPAPRHHVTEKSCALPQVATVGSNGISVCSLPSKAPASPILQTLERRAGKKTPEKKKAYKKKVVAKKKAAGIHIPKSRKARAQARVKAGKPKATAKDKGRVPGAPHVKPKKGPISANKKARVDERKENRRLGKLQKQSNVIADAKQKQKMPPYALDADGKFKKIEEKDVAKKAWAKHEKAKTDKATRKADWAKLSTTEQAKQQAAKQAAQATSRTAHKTSNIKETNRQKRITTKAAARTQRKNDNRAHAKVAKAEYKNAVGLPTNRKEVYSSPQGKTYTGKDVRQAVFASELAKAKGGVGYNKFTGKTTTVAKDKLPKNFENRPNSDGSHPLHGVPAGPGMIEYPIVHNKQNGHDGRKPTPSDARIVTKKNAAGHTELIGKVGHTTGSNDHKGF